MSQIVQGVKSIVAGMNKKEKAELLQLLLEDEHLAEDLSDCMLILRRRKELHRPFEDFERDMNSPH